MSPNWGDGCARGASASSDRTVRFKTPRRSTESPTRNDIDERTFLPGEIIPRPDVNYFDTFEWQFTLTTKEQVRLRMKELLSRR